ncbi:MAG TPA: hypothetical protein VFT65_06180 [Candidatus Angelobacter sp.]|nr:hypothetical protein [Candidatus Angelobacter sp.]
MLIPRAAKASVLVWIGLIIVDCGCLGLVQADRPRTYVPETSSGQNTAPEIVEWTRHFTLPDDILFARHQTWKIDALIFLVSADATGKVREARPIAGFSLYLNPIASQIKQIAFPARLAGKTFVLRVPDPLQRFKTDAQLYHAGRCAPDSELRKLYQLGAMFWRSQDNDAASICYKFILERNPASVAARWGLATICVAQKDRCADEYLESVIASNPEFTEARERLIAKPTDPERFVEGLRELLSASLPPATRLKYLTDLAFWLNKMNRIDEEVETIDQWNAAADKLMEIYPLAASRYTTEAMHFGLVEESTGHNEGAIDSYRLVLTSAAHDSLFPLNARYDTEMGMARALRRTGHGAEAADVCKRWQKKWRKLASHPVHHPWELREAGPDELGGEWEFSCGDQEKGLALIQKAAKEYPDSNEPYTALAHYYYSTGQVSKARDAEATASRMLDEWGKKLGEF